MVTRQETHEMSIMLWSLVVVILIALGLYFLSSTTFVSNQAGAAIALDMDHPTYAGMLSLLENSCQLVDSVEGLSCSQVCQNLAASCLALEEQCSTMENEFACYCCSFGGSS